MTRFLNRMTNQYDDGFLIKITRHLFISCCLILSLGVQHAGAQAFWLEDFGNSAAGNCEQGTLAASFSSTQGTWTVTSMGPEDPDANRWYISPTEPGKPAGDCSTQGCYINSQYTDRTLHIGNVSTSPNALTLCPTGDCGAVYDAGGFQNAVQTNSRVESPVINCTGQYGIILYFNYFMNADDPSGNDNLAVEYFDGTTWNTIADPPMTDPMCGQGFGLWTRYAVALGFSADNNAGIKIGFTWKNDNGGVGVNPSVAIDSIALIGTLQPVADFEASDTVLCTGDCIDFTDLSQNFPNAWSWSFIGGTPATSSTEDPSSVCFLNPGSYTVQLIVSNSSGSDTLTKVDYITVNACTPPTAGFAADSTDICERTCINFTDQSINGASGWKWLFPGGTPSTSTDQNPQQICYYTPGVYPVTQIVYNQFGSDTLVLPDYIKVNTCPLPVADFATFTPAICSNSCINFFDQSTYGPTSWSWYFPGATPDTSTAQNPVGICYPTDGFYDVQLIVSNGYGSDTTIKYSYVHVESVPNSFVSSDTAMYFGGSYQLIAGGGATYSWSPAYGLDTTAGSNPIATPQETTTYTVNITDITGCSATRQVTVTILHNNNFFVPNSFSPNNDGYNDYLFVRGNNLYGIRFTVFDRWGEKVWETTSQTEGWDGRYKGKELDPAVFTYVLTIIYDDGKNLTQTGTITLLR